MERRHHKGRPDRGGIAAAIVVGLLSAVFCGLYVALISRSDVGTALDRPPASYVAWLALTAAQAVIVAWYRSHPMQVFCAVGALFLVSALVTGDGGLTPATCLPLWFAVFALAAGEPARRSIPLIAAMWLANSIAQVTLFLLGGLGPLGLADAAIAVTGRGYYYIAAAAVGIAVRLQRERGRDASERAKLAERGAAAEARAAVEAERNRMARDLHDLAAHQLMDLVLTARAARFEPDQAGAALEQVDRMATAAMTSLRAAVGALRDEGSKPAATRPLAPTLHDMAEAYRTRHEVELAVRIDDEERLSALDADQTAALVHIASEALANAARHAPGAPAGLSVWADDRGAHLLARNRLVAPASHGRDPVLPRADRAHNLRSGFGLLGARERAEIVGGTVSFGPTDDGEWLVTAFLPFRPAGTSTDSDPGPEPAAFSDTGTPTEVTS